jgi:predicted transposase YbfD/YdcC
MIEREITKKATGKTSLELVYGITSQTPAQTDAATLLRQNRNHWGIESLHWIRDATFDEDRSTIRSGSAPRVMAAIRNFVIGLLRLLGFDNFAKARRAFAASARSTLALLRL